MHSNRNAMAPRMPVRENALTPLAPTAPGFAAPPSYSRPGFDPTGPQGGHLAPHDPQEFRQKLAGAATQAAVPSRHPRGLQQRHQSIRDSLLW